jgi:hypothetical protein
MRIIILESDAGRALDVSQAKRRHEWRRGKHECSRHVHGEILKLGFDVSERTIARQS